MAENHVNTTRKLAAKFRPWDYIQTIGHITISLHFFNKKYFKKEKDKMGEEDGGQIYR